MLNKIAAEPFDAHDTHAANDKTDSSVSVCLEGSSADSGASFLPVTDSSPSSLSPVGLQEISRMRSAGMLDDIRFLETFVYRVTLAFCPFDLFFYIFLDQEGAPWHAAKATHLYPAEQLFQQLVEQAVRLSATAVRRAESEARNSRLARHIETANAEVKALQEEVERQISQEQRLVSRQGQLAQDMKQLESGRVRAQIELNRLHQHIQQLGSTLRRKEPRLRSSAQRR